MFCTVNIPVSEYSPECLRELDDLARLDAAVADGRLSKYTVHIPALVSWDGAEGTAHFYCQKGCESDMREVAEFHKAIWEGREGDATLARDPGFYLGYTERDVALFEAGGYEALAPPLRLLMTCTHQWRKTARLKSLRPIDFS